jgi:hypothetical protein
VQRSDLVTLGALRALSQELRDHPIAWVLARSGTPDRGARYLFGVLRRTAPCALRLAPLGQDEVAALLSGTFGARPAGRRFPPVS